MSFRAVGRRVLAAALTLSLSSFTGLAVAAELTLKNVSYDPTRELYAEFNPAFSKYWQEKTGNTVTIEQSHAGSGK
ncbi:MAG: sulfate transporter subunit, partial [Thiothrix sp.]